MSFCEWWFDSMPDEEGIFLNINDTFPFYKLLNNSSYHFWIEKNKKLWRLMNFMMNDKKWNLHFESSFIFVDCEMAGIRKFVNSLFKWDWPLCWFGTSSCKEVEKNEIAFAHHPKALQWATPINVMTADHKRKNLFWYKLDLTDHFSLAWIVETSSKDENNARRCLLNLKEPHHACSMYVRELLAATRQIVITNDHQTIDSLSSMSC